MPYRNDRFRGNYLNIDILGVSMYEFIDRDGHLDDNEPIHKKDNLTVIRLVTF